MEAVSGKVNDVDDVADVLVDTLQQPALRLPGQKQPDAQGRREKQGEKD